MNCAKSYFLNASHELEKKSEVKKLPRLPRKGRRESGERSQDYGKPWEKNEKKNGDAKKRRLRGGIENENEIKFWSYCIHRLKKIELEEKF